MFPPPEKMSQFEQYVKENEDIELRLSSELEKYLWGIEVALVLEYSIHFKSRQKALRIMFTVHSKSGIHGIKVLKRIFFLPHVIPNKKICP